MKNTNNKKTLYESIMRRVSKVVKQAINESCGVDEINTFVDDFIVAVQEGGTEYEDLFDENGNGTDDLYDILDELGRRISEEFGCEEGTEEYEMLRDKAERRFIDTF